jgi:hypothetical protein
MIEVAGDISSALTRVFDVLRPATMAHGVIQLTGTRRVAIGGTFMTGSHQWTRPARFDT